MFKAKVYSVSGQQMQKKVPVFGSQRTFFLLEWFSCHPYNGTLVHFLGSQRTFFLLNKNTRRCFNRGSVENLRNNPRCPIDKVVKIKEIHLFIDLTLAKMPPFVPIKKNKTKRQPPFGKRNKKYLSNAIGSYSTSRKNQSTETILLDIVP